MMIRRECTGDEQAVAQVHAAAFAASAPGRGEPVEVALVARLRASSDWLPALSLVAVEEEGAVVGHVVCTRATVGGSVPALGLGPIGVVPGHQDRGVGHALMHAVLGAADALDEHLVALLGDQRFYRRFGFRPATDVGVVAPDPAWGDHFQVRTLTTHDPSVAGPFRYAAPFDAV